MTDSTISNGAPELDSTPNGINTLCSASEASIFEAFKQRCAEGELLARPAALGSEDALDGITDDITLFRFLRARRFNIDGALKQFKEASDARATYNLFNIYDNIDVTEFEKARRLYPCWIGRRDKQGQPIFAFDITQLDHNTMAAYKSSRNNAASPNQIHGTGSVSEIVRAYVYHDSLTRFILPLCSACPDRAEPSKPVVGCLYLVDISGFGLKQAWTLRSYTQDISKLLATSYPEVIDRVLVIGAPSYFSKIWSLLKGWIDPVTAQKIVILSQSEVLPTLAEYVDVENIPSKFGGQFDYQPAVLPNLDDTERGRLGNNMQLVGSTLPPGPIKWVTAADGSVVAKLVGRRDSGA